MANVLVVDDDPDLAAAVTDLLQDVGHTVRIAHDGWAGIDALNEEALPDVVLLDLEMPFLDGPGMVYLMFVRDSGREKIPIVLVSAAVDLAAVATRVGTPYSLAKPCEGRALLGIVERALSERRAPHPQLEAPAVP